MASKEVVVACQSADIATTLYAISHGAVETNPIPIPALILIKVAIIVWVLSYTKEEWEKEEEGARAIIAAAGCIPAANNIIVIKNAH